MELSSQILERVGELGSRFELRQMLLDTTITFLNFGLIKAVGFERGFQGKEQCLFPITMQTFGHRFA